MSEEVCVIFRVKRTNAGTTVWSKYHQSEVYERRYEIEPMMRLQTSNNISEHGAACLCEACLQWRKAQP